MLCTGVNVLVPGAPCVCVSQAAEGKCVGRCQQAVPGTLICPCFAVRDVRAAAGGIQ